jgi:predicted transcriptional regulator
MHMKAIRTTVSIPKEQLEELQRIADQHSLSLAWLVRQAIAEFLERTEHGTTFHPLAASSKSKN